MDTYLRKYNYEVIDAGKNGHCFITSIRVCLECDHGMIFTDNDIQKLIMWEVFQNNNTYTPFYSGCVLPMLWALDRYIHNEVYSQQVVDIAVLAAAKILRVNMCIYHNQDKRAILYAQPCVPPSSRDVYL